MIGRPDFRYPHRDMGGMQSLMFDRLARSPSVSMVRRPNHDIMAWVNCAGHWHAGCRT